MASFIIEHIPSNLWKNLLTQQFGCHRIIVNFFHDLKTGLRRQHFILLPFQQNHQRCLEDISQCVGSNVLWKGNYPLTLQYEKWLNIYCDYVEKLFLLYVKPGYKRCVSLTIVFILRPIGVWKKNSSHVPQTFQFSFLFHRNYN